MNFLTLARKRCSVRTYSAQAIEQEVLDRVLEAARMAPSAVNYQPWTLLVVREEAGKEKLHSTYRREWFYTAPMYIVVCAEHSQSWKRRADGKDHADIDASILTEHLCLAAAEEGLGTCIVCNFDTEALKEAFALPEETEPIVILPIGYPEDPSIFERTPKKRKTMEEIVKYEHY